MITITQLAKELNVSRATLYSDVSKAGLSIDTLTDAKQGRNKPLTEEGECLIRQLYVKKKEEIRQDKCVNDTLTRQADTSENASKRVKQLTDELTAAIARAEEAERQLAAAEQQAKQDKQLIEQLHGIIEEKNATIADKQRTIEQQERNMERLNTTIQAQAMTAAAQATAIQELSSRGWLQRIFHIGAGKSKPQKVVTVDNDQEQKGE